MRQTSTILIVDDESSGRETLAALLRPQAYELAFAGSGAEALAQVVALDPDLILLDVMMPELNGFEVCRQLRATPAVAEIPIILLTALDDRESRLQGIEAGADDFVTKPFDRVELRTRIRAITRLNRYRRAITERQQAEERARQQIERLSALRAIDTAIGSSLDLHVTISVILAQTTIALHVDGAAILLRQPERQVLEYVGTYGIRQGALMQTTVYLGAGCAGYVALQQRALHLPGSDEPDSPSLHPLQSEGFTSYYGLPLVVKGRVEGVLEIFHRALFAPDPEWLECLETLARQTAIAVDNARLFDSMQRANTELSLAYDTTLEGWARALELRDKETEGHAQRVTAMTLQLAEAMGIDEAEQAHLRRGALLHDIGKMGVPDSILLKPGPLTDDEWAVMRKHPSYAYELLAPIRYLRSALDIPHYHHEKWDGSGYPHGLKGEAIPLAARIFAVVDVWDALRFDRPYRKAWQEEEVNAHIRSLAGSHFDPRVVAAFERLQSSGHGEAQLAVLVVDDEEFVADALGRALQDCYIVHTATSADAALEILSREQIAVIVTDQRMPGLTGVQLLERAKQMSPTTSGLLCSGFYDGTALSHALNLGIVRGFISKPWTTAELRERVDAVARQYHAPLVPAVGKR
jgi:response regulator RpfG family c-di-GMP phosphodiesterase